jgi:NADH:ubiquinone oxidoreductase subunit 6 (subunit J)
MGEAIYWPSFFFLLYAVVACAFAVAVLLATNIVRMAFYLTLSLSATAGLFFLAGADFVGAMQLMIYVGGTLVLLIFGVMLTSQERFVEMKTWSGDWVFAFLIGGTLLMILIPAAFSVPQWSGLELAEAQSVEVENTATPLGMGLLGARVDQLEGSERTESLQPGYLLLFEIVSIHLLVVLVGAAYLARAKRRREGSV